MSGELALFPDLPHPIGGRWFWGLLVFLISLAVSLAFVVVILVRLPANYLQDDEDSAAPSDRNRPSMHWTIHLVRNLLGFAVIAVGIIISIPGVPGQGLLTVLVGVMLLTFPAKRRWERRLFGVARVRAAVNRLRVFFGRPPLTGPATLPARESDRPSA